MKSAKQTRESVHHVSDVIMSKVKILPILLCILTTAMIVKVVAKDLPPEMINDSDKPYALKMNLENPWRPAQQKIVLPINKDRPQSATLKFPGRKVPQNKLLVLRFRSRFHWSVVGGSNHFLAMNLNGQSVDSETKDGMFRILNRMEPFARTTDPRFPRESYFKKTYGPPALLTMFSSGWKSLEPIFISDRKELFWYVIDITDLAKQKGGNVLELKNLAPLKSFTRDMSEYPLLIDDLEIGLVPVSSRVFKQDVDADFNAFKVAQSLSGIDIAISNGGAFRVNFNNDSYLLKSSFSEAGKSIKHHLFSSSPDKSWDVSVKKDNDTLIAIGTAGSYTITRKADLDGSFIRITDTIKNTSDRDIGIIIEHSLLTGRPTDSWRLAGIKNVPTTNRPCYNPTIHASQKNSGLGIAIKDSVFRAEMSVAASFNRIFTMSNEQFGLKKGASYTMQWSLRIGGPDFWEFINALRRDWNVNHTIPGMFSFFYPRTTPIITPSGLLKNRKKLQAYVKHIRIDTFSAAPWYNYFFESPEKLKVPFKHFKNPKQFKKEVQEIATALKAVQPDAKIIASLESFLCYKSVDFFKGTLPKFWTDTKGAKNSKNRSIAPHSFSLSSAGTKVVDATPWRDSVFRDKKGNVEVDLYYTWCYEGDSDGGANLKVFPTLNNHWQKEFMGVIDYCINKCGLDGVYVDSFNYYNQRTFSIWDGHSVDLDFATGAIKQKYANLTLLTAKARREWVKSCLDKGKIFYTNGKPATSELQDLPFVSFMEAEWSLTQEGIPDAPGAAQSMLHSPLSLGIRPTIHINDKSQHSKLLQRAVISYLRYGSLYCHYSGNVIPLDAPGGYGVLNHMFPFTPVELHEGWVVGKERIITCLSRTYNWPHKAKPACLLFDNRGLLKKGGITFIQKGAGWDVKVSLNDWNETAVIKFSK